jgi:hypothetical protein
MYQGNYHQLTPQRELVEMFREMCLPEKVAQDIKKVETMPAAWALLDKFYGNFMAFVLDLMQMCLLFRKLRRMSTYMSGSWSTKCYCSRTSGRG